MSMVEKLKTLETSFDETSVFKCGYVYNPQKELTPLFAKVFDKYMTLYYNNEPYGLCAIADLPNLHPQCVSGTEDEKALQDLMIASRGAEFKTGVISTEDAYYGIAQLESLQIYRVTEKGSDGVSRPVLIDCSGYDAYDVEVCDAEFEEVMSVMQ